MHKLISILALLALTTLSGFAADWVNYENKEGGFKIQMPRQPVASNEDVGAEKGNATMKMFLCNQSKYKDDNELYFVAYIDELDSSISSDMEDAQVDDLLHTSINGGANDVAGNITSENVVQLKGYRGREGKILVPDKNYVLYMRAFLIHSRLYLLEVACETTKDNNTSISKFFNSFDVAAATRVPHVKPENNNWATLQRDKFKVKMPELPQENLQDVNSK